MREDTLRRASSTGGQGCALKADSRYAKSLCKKHNECIPQLEILAYPPREKTPWEAENHPPHLFRSLWLWWHSQKLAFHLQESYSVSGNFSFGPVCFPVFGEKSSRLPFKAGRATKGAGLEAEKAAELLHPWGSNAIRLSTTWLGRIENRFIVETCRLKGFCDTWQVPVVEIRHCKIWSWSINCYDQLNTLDTMNEQDLCLMLPQTIS